MLIIIGIKFWAVCFNIEDRLNNTLDGNSIILALFLKLEFIVRKLLSSYIIYYSIVYYFILILGTFDFVIYSLVFGAFILSIYEYVIILGYNR